MATEVEVKKPWWKSWWGILTIIFLVLIGWLAGYFVYQFFHYYRLAKRGELSGAELTFSDKFLTTDRLRRQYTNTPTTDVAVATSDAPRLGEDDAPLVVVGFSDFGCPWSREESFVIRELAAQYPDKMLFVYRNFPIDELHPQARLAAEGGKCAQELGNFWAYHDKVFQNNDRMSRSDLIGFAREIGLGEQAFSECLDSGKYSQAVEKDYEDGFAAGVRGTPTFFLNGRRVEGAIPRDIFERIIEAVTSL